MADLMKTQVSVHTQKPTISRLEAGNKNTRNFPSLH